MLKRYIPFLIALVGVVILVVSTRSARQKSELATLNTKSESQAVAPVVENSEVAAPVVEGPEAAKAKEQPKKRVVSTRRRMGSTNGKSYSRAGSLIADLGAEPSQDLEFELLTGHLMGLDRGRRSFTEFFVGAQYHLSDDHTIGLKQEAKKLYEIAASGESEFLVADTVLFHQMVLSPDYAGLDIQLRTQVSLPVSQVSRDNKHVTRPSIGLHLTKALFSNVVELKYVPTFSYSFNRYASDARGVPMERMSLGQYAQARINLVGETLGLVAWGKGIYHMYEEHDFSRTTPAPDTSYEYGSYLGLQITPGIGTRLGYVRGNSMINDAHYDIPYYDAPAPRGYLSLNISL